MADGMTEFSNKAQLDRVAAGLTGEAPFFNGLMEMRPMRFVEGVPTNARAVPAQSIPAGEPMAPWGSRHIRK